MKNRVSHAMHEVYGLAPEPFAVHPVADRCM